MILWTVLKQLNLNLKCPFTSLFQSVWKMNVWVVLIKGSEPGKWNKAPRKRPTYRRIDLWVRIKIY